MDETEEGRKYGLLLAAVVKWHILAALLLLASGCAQTAPPPVESSQLPPALPDGVAVFGGPRAGDSSLAVGTPRVFLTGFSGGEPNMGVTSTGSVFASAFDDIIRSRDGGETWEVVQTNPLMNSDPMMYVDPWTDCIYNVPMSVILLGSTIFESCDDGDTWDPIHGQNQGRGVYDHQKFGSALPGPDAPPIAGVIHPTVLIICYNGLVVTNCAISFDDGRTWPHDVPVWSATPLNEGSDTTCAGQQSHPTGAPDGTMVVAKAWGCAEAFVIVSTDSGLTWTTRMGPTGVGADTLDPEIAFSADGAMYMLWQSKRGEDYAYLARSNDMGQSWSGPWNVTPPGMGSSIFASLHAGSTGRVAMAFHATNYTVYPSDAEDDAKWYTYVVTSEDADADEPTFVSYRVQPLGDPVQIGGICNGNQGCVDGNRNLLDFIDGGVGPDGTFYTVISDGCTDGCAGNPDATPQDSRDNQVAMVRLDGWSLYA